MESRSSYGYYGSAGGFTGENPPVRKKVVPKETEYFIAVWKWNGKDYVKVPSRHSTSREYMEGLFNAVKIDNDSPCVELWQVDTYGTHLIWQVGNTYRREYE